MFTLEVKEHYEEHYEKKNHKKARSLNVPERLYKDFHKFCIDKGKSMSEVIRLLMVRYMLDNKI